MKWRLTSFMVLLTFLAALVVLPQTQVWADDDDDDDDNQSTFLKRIPINGTLPGGSFTGYLTITDLVLSDDETTLLASGEVQGRSVVNGVRKQIKQTFTNVPVLVSEQQPTAAGEREAAALPNEQTRRCNILFLTIPGGIFLDLLGLQLTIAPITIDLTAVSGRGRLLGNLLCGIVNLLN
jgi:hypothetical protein